MRVAVYARVSTPHQAQTQTIEQQLTRLQNHIKQQGWTLEESFIYRDDGYSGARLNRPGLDALRDRAAMAEIDVVLVSAPDRLARKYVHQVLLIEELQRQGCQVQFVERPMNSDPHDQLLLQIRGAVAEYERSLITERMRRGKVAKMRAGQLLPWTRRPFGYRLDAERPRDPTQVRLDEYESAVIRQIFAWYLEEHATLYSIARRLHDQGVESPRGQAYWTNGSIRGVLTNTAYIGTTYGNRFRIVSTQGRRSALSPVGSGESHQLKPATEWIPITVPAIVTQKEFDLVQEKLSHNQQRASRNNKRHEYLLRGLVNCGMCRLTAAGRTTAEGYRYYVCRGRVDKVRRASGEACLSRYLPAEQLDALVWADLCEVLSSPEQIAVALERAQSGQWLPQELPSRQATVKQAMAVIERRQERLLEAYLSEVLSLKEYDRKREELRKRETELSSQQRQLEAVAQERHEIAQVVHSIEEFCARVRVGLDRASFEEKRWLIELLIDCVVVKNEAVEIRYVVPTSEKGSHQPFCRLRMDYRRGLLK